MKRYLSGLLAIVIAVSAAAFTTIDKHPTALQWYKLNAGGNPSVAADYTLYGANPGCPMRVSSAVCAIQADPGSGSHPDATELSAIKTASSNFTQQAANLEYKP